MIPLFEKKKKEKGKKPKTELHRSKKYRDSTSIVYCNNTNGLFSLD